MTSAACSGREEVWAFCVTACGCFILAGLPLRALGLAQQQPQAGQMIEQILTALFERGWLVGEERLSVTDLGKERLRRGMRGTRGERHHLFAGRRVHGRRWRRVPEQTEKAQSSD